MKIESLTMTPKATELHVSIDGKDVKALFGLFPELTAVAGLIDEKKSYALLLTDAQVIEVNVLRSKMETVAAPQQAEEEQEDLKTDEGKFLRAVLKNAAPRGPWKFNPSSHEPRQEQMLVTEFFTDGKLKGDFEPWHGIIESQTMAVENPAIYSIAMIPDKVYALAETDAERQQLKTDALKEARRQLRDTALGFYSGSLNQQEEMSPQGENAL